jgi:hypothetical protein
MTYKSLKTFSTLRRTFHEGHQYELNPTEAEELLAIGAVEAIKSSAPKKATPIRSVKKAETSVAPDVEVASDL